MPFEYDAGKKTPYLGQFSLTTQYHVNDWVSSGNDLYKCIQDSLGNEITNTEYFTKIDQTLENYQGIFSLDIQYYVNNYTSLLEMIYTNVLKIL